MAQCRATNKRGAQCRNAALPGSEYCDVIGHGPAVTAVVAEGAPTPPPSPAPPPPADDPWGWLSELPADAGPASEPVAAPGDLPPVQDVPGEGGDWLDNLDVPEEDGAPSSAGRWTPENTGRLINPPLNAVFEATGKDRQKPAEEKYTAEVFAPIFDDLLSKVNPNSPYGALSLWCLSVILPRYAGDMVRAVMPGRRAVAPPPPAPSEMTAVPQENRAFRWD